MTTMIQKCEGCGEREADPREEWWFTYKKSVKLCKRCARMLASHFTEFVEQTCRPKGARRKAR
jgi:hypothetical protein